MDKGEAISIEVPNFFEMAAGFLSPSLEEAEMEPLDMFEKINELSHLLLSVYVAGIHAASPNTLTVCMN